MYLRCSRSRNINKKTGGQSWVFVLGYIIWWPFSSQANQPLQRTKINKQQAKDGVIRIHDMIAGKHVKTTCTLKTWCPKNTKWLTSEHDVFSRKRPSFPKLKLFFACRWRKRTKRCAPPPGAPESSGRSPPKRASRKEELRWEVNLSSSREEVNFRIDFSEIRKYTIHNQCVNVEWMDMWWFELVEPRVKMKLGRPFLPVFHFPWGWATRFLEIQGGGSVGGSHVVNNDCHSFLWQPLKLPACLCFNQGNGDTMFPSNHPQHLSFSNFCFLSLVVTALERSTFRCSPRTRSLRTECLRRLLWKPETARSPGLRPELHGQTFFHLSRLTRRRLQERTDDIISCLIWSGQTEINRKDLWLYQFHMNPIQLMYQEVVLNSNFSWNFSKQRNYHRDLGRSHVASSMAAGPSFCEPWPVTSGGRYSETHCDCRRGLGLEIPLWVNILFRLIIPCSI